MSALFRVGVIACTLLFSYGPALAVPQSQQAQPVPGLRSSEIAHVSPESRSSVAAALRASTRNDPANFVPSVETIQEFLTGPHTGPVEDAVVGVEVVNKAKDGATETRHCSGLLLRCDGFFAIPPAITALQMSGGTEAVRQTVRVTLHPGTPKEQTAQAYIRHYIIHGIDITVMKVQGVHSPAARPLLPDQLKPGDKVELAWTDWDAGTGRFSTVKHRLANLGQPDLAVSAINGGLISFTAMQDSVPGGAAVIGPDGMAIGILPGSSARHDRFTSFSVLATVTNCVVAVPTTDEEFARLQKLDKQGNEAVVDGAAADPPAAPLAADAAAKPKRPTNDMIDIPGGPVRLPKAFQEDQRDMCAEVIACVPAFKIDRFKVSNREYYDFWMSIPEKDRAKREVRAALYPVSWADTDPPFPAEIDDVPVIGVSVAAAQAYAKSKGKRLATTYEWTRAVFGPFGDAALPAWVTEYMRQRQEAWNRIVSAHEQYLSTRILPRLRQNQAAREFDQASRKIDRPTAPLPLPPKQIVPPGTIPFYSADDQFSEACNWSQRLLQSEVKQLCERWINPLYLLPSGSRPYDTSPYGLMDVLLNGNERVVHSPESIRGVDPPTGGRPTATGLGFALRDAWWAKPDLPLAPLTVPRSLLFSMIEDAGGNTLLLSRRLVASSSLVRPQLREFSPSDSERFSEYRAQIYEEMLMALPLEFARVSSVRSETMTTDAWGEGTIVQRPAARPAVQIGLDLGPGITGYPVSNQYHAQPIEGPRLMFTNDLGKRLPGELDHAYTIQEHSDPRIASVRSRKEIVSMGYKIHYGDSVFVGGPFSNARHDEAIPIFGGIYFDETWFYPLLAGLSPYMIREMGREWAKDPVEHIGPWPELNETLTQPPDLFLIANGFRCAR